MIRSFILLALVAILVRPALAHDCPCECLAQDDGQQTVQAVPSWQQIPEPAAQTVRFLPLWQRESKPHLTYAHIQVMSVSLDGVTTIVLGEATPSFLVTHVLEENGIQNEWLVPLTCAELERVEDALYARHHVDFEDPADEAFFAAATIGIYRPVPNLTRQGAEHFFTPQDRLTQLRVDRAQADANCSN